MNVDYGEQVRYIGDATDGGLSGGELGIVIGDEIEEVVCVDFGLSGNGVGGEYLGSQYVNSSDLVEG